VIEWPQDEPGLDDFPRPNLPRQVLVFGHCSSPSH
jgi:hypothetical protein